MNSKNTIIAVVLSVVIIIGFSLYNLAGSDDDTTQVEQRQQSQQVNNNTRQPETKSESVSQNESGSVSSQTTEPAAVPDAQQQAVSKSDYSWFQHKLDDPQNKYMPLNSPVNVSLDNMTVDFSLKQAGIRSLVLHEYKDAEMILTGESEDSAYRLVFEQLPENYGNSHFTAYRGIENPDEFVFVIGFTAPAVEGGVKPFVIKKTFSFSPDIYGLHVEVAINNLVEEGQIGKFTPFFEKNGYYLVFGPQIGPEYNSLGGRSGEYRRFYYLENGKRKQAKKDTNILKVSNDFGWMSLTGKYFGSIILPPNDVGSIKASTEARVPGLDDVAYIALIRDRFESTSILDEYICYLGPNKKEFLAKNGNDFELNAKSDRFFLFSMFGWLEDILRWLLNIFYMMTGNYGIAIILLTIFTNLALFPLTKKSSESMAKMQKLNPKMTEIREKYAKDPEKMNKEIAELYRTENVNPLGGCLPLLLRLPLFIALFGVLNTYFELRGAVFIPGWLTDLSSPESGLLLPFSIPFLGSSLRFLPIIFLASQLFTSKLTQASSTSSNNQMKMLGYALPLVFFFVLYGMPSGLLIYWIFSNIISSGQQIFINHRMKQKEEAESSTITVNKKKKK